MSIKSIKPIHISVGEEYHTGVYIVRINSHIIDTLAEQSRAYSLANRIAGALDSYNITVNRMADAN